MKLIITEKRSQVDDITKAMGWKSMGSGISRGNYDNDEVIITCAKGHIMGLDSPDKMVEGLTWQTVDKMTPIPKNFKKIILNDGKSNKGMTSKQYFDRIKKHAKEADEIIIAADPDREGDLIGWEIIEELKFKKNIKRLSLLHGMDTAGIKKSFNEIIDSENSKKSAVSAEARERGDWAFILVTMAYTFFGRKGAFGSNLCAGKGKSSIASLGRVQTPLLKMINNRCEEIDNFVSRTYYNIRSEFKIGDASIEASYKPYYNQDTIDKNHEWIYWEPSKSQDNNALDRPLFIDKKRVDDFINRLHDKKDEAYVKSYNAREKFKNPPAPFDLASINSEGAKALGCKNSAIQEAVSSLYSKGFVSYPRTDEREIPESIYYGKEKDIILDNLYSGLDDLKDQISYVKSIHSGNNVSVEPFKPKAFSNKNMSHYAIIPTTQAPDFNNMTNIERGVYSIIAKRFVLLMYPPAKINETTATFIVPVKDLLENNESEFYSKAEIIIDPGYLSAFSEKENKGSTLPEMKQGTSTPLIKSYSKEDKTKPPPYYNDSNIETAMKTIGRDIEDPQLKKFLKKTQGIGRPSTRIVILENLVDRSYITRSKEGIIVTKLGKDLLDIVPDWLSSPAMTAVWEGYLENIANAQSVSKSEEMRDKFVDKQYHDLSEMIKKLIEENKEKVDMSNSSGKPSEKQLEYANNIARDLGLNLPEQAKDDYRECSKFIDDNKEKHQKHVKENGGGSKSNPPTEKMLGLAEKIARENNIDLPEDAKKYFESCKSFINENMRPSEKMVNYAKNLMEQNDIEPKEDWEKDYKYVKEIIDKYANN